MPNPTGKNGAGTKTYPADEVLKETLLKYVHQGLTQKQKIERLAKDHNLQIGTTKLNQLEKKLEIPSVRRTPAPREVAAQAIADEVDKDTAQQNGPNYVKSKLKDKLIMVPRDTVRRVMHEWYPEGPELRYPGHKKTKISRRPLSALGPFHEVSSDGHEKLGAQALKMGDIGLPIYGWKDKWTAYLLKLNVVPESRTNAAIAHLYLDFIEELGGIPIQTTTDKGSETGWLYALQTALREAFAAGIHPEVYPEHAFVKSVHNTIIEAFWRWLHQKLGFNLKDHILRGQVDHIFNSNVPFHRHLFNWIFPPLVQAELDEFRVYWNQHKIRSQHLKNMPSGHVPADVLEHPEFYGGINCRIEVPRETVHLLRELLTEEVGPREQHLAWVTPEFSDIADAVHEALGRPYITLQNSWTIFSQMSARIEDLGIAMDMS
ncbi:hypothetical protein C8R46DRAFT_429357 [Mycena filopes]|nr:hypothetical protein C8R46DRAFT_429357 [Mycena filopes]